LFTASALACGGSSDGPSAATPQSLSGTYSTRVTLVQNNCGTITVHDNPTTVVHNASSGAITLMHAGTTYAGTVQADSSFATTPRAVDVNDGFQYTIQISGRFRASTFEADATVDRARQGITCRYTVHWAGTRQ
jgi:hypothetical protein